MTIKWNRRCYSKEEFTEAWNSSLSISECARKLKIGVTSPTTKKTAMSLGLTQKHMLGSRSSLGKVPPNKRLLSEILVYGKEENSHHLKLRLISDGILKRQCSSCLLVDWLGSPLPIELDHINGDRLDHRIENLRILCPNCHTLTPTYRGKNISLKKTI